MILSVIGSVFFIRYFIFMCMGNGAGHTQSLIFASTMLIAGVQTLMVGLLGDVISANRKILQDIQYHVRKMDYDKESGRDEANYDEVVMISKMSEQLGKKLDLNGDIEIINNTNNSNKEN